MSCLMDGREEVIVTAVEGDLQSAIYDQLMDLRAYLDLQFERQSHLIQCTHLKHNAPPTRPAPAAPHAPHAPHAPRLRRNTTTSELQRSWGSEEYKSEIRSHQSEEPDEAIRSNHFPKLSTFSLASMASSAYSNSNKRRTLVKTAVLERCISAQMKEQKRKRERFSMVQNSILVEEEEGTLQRFVSSSSFSYALMALIVMNAILMGIEIDVTAGLAQEDIPGWFAVVNSIFVVIFVIEISLRILAFGCYSFWRGEENWWNIWDFLIVLVSVVVIAWWASSLLEFQNYGSNTIRVLRALRLARIFRGVRITRLFRYFSALRALILSIMSTMGSLMWTLFLLLVIFYIFSLIFAELVSDFCRSATNNSTLVPVCPDNEQGLEGLVYWEGIIQCMHTLFMTITGGIDWNEAYRPLKKVSFVGVTLMNLYIVIGFFTILNVITGVFVNTAIEGASADKDIATLKQAQNRVMHVASLRQAFHEIETATGHLLNAQDLAAAMEEDKLSAFMESLGISTDDVWTLFLLIDKDDDGLVDIEQFVAGCMQLRGPAKSLQVAKMSYENRITREQIKRIVDDMDELKADVAKLVEARERKLASVLGPQAVSEAL
ncbi:unnamed protein product [Durusdinium trenchii]|uniref:EF-hand domain-containing protein n=2 Tax=Durusdinium trenchii TaxID=1381693 RepID=A0ABP0PMM1_9DINO